MVIQNDPRWTKQKDSKEMMRLVRGSISGGVFSIEVNTQFIFLTYAPNLPRRKPFDPFAITFKADSIREAATMADCLDTAYLEGGYAPSEV